MNMKRIIRLTVILSLLATVCHAQQKHRQIETIGEYKTAYDSIVSLLRVAEKDTSSCIGKPFSEFVKILDKAGVKITKLRMGYFDSQKLYPQHLWAIDVKFTTEEQNIFARNNDLMEPLVCVNFTESQPFEKALSLHREYKSSFTEEVAEFYSGAIIQSVNFYFLDRMYSLEYFRKRNIKQEELKSID
jgi:hypothetical protein